MKALSILCALLGVAAVGAEEVREVVVEKLPWSVTEYLAPLEEELEKDDITVRVKYGEQVVELRDVGITSKGNGVLWLGDEMVRVYDAHDDGILYDGRWADVQLEDVNGDGAADLTVCWRELHTVDEQDKDLATPLPQGIRWRLFLWDAAARKGPVEVGWRFSSCAEGGEAVFPHRLEIQQEGEAPVAVWRSFKSPAFLGYVDAGEYAVAFFADPLIRPDGNIILAWRLVPGKAPALIFATPYSDDKGVDYDLCDLRVEGNRVLGRITARLTEGHRELPSIPVELNAQTPPIDFRSPFYPNHSGD